jgi:hypothetical protein
LGLNFSEPFLHLTRADFLPENTRIFGAKGLVLAS